MLKRVAVDYFKHIDGFFQKLVRDNNITSIDVALYSVLMHKWNKAFYNSPFKIYRKEMLKLTKISHDTYGVSLRRLVQAGFIKYKKGGGETVPAEIIMTRFDRAADKQDNFHADTISGISSSPDSGAANPELRSVSYPNSGTIENNEINKTIKHYDGFKKKFHEMVETSAGIVPDLGTIINTYYDGKAESTVIPGLHQVKEYFQSSGFPEYLAEKYFRFNEKAGWCRCRKPDDWKLLANEVWMAKNENLRVRKAINEPECTDSQTWYRQFLRGKLNIGKVPSHLFETLQLTATEEILAYTLATRINLLVGSSSHKDCLLLEAYRSGNMQEALVCDDKDFFDTLTKQVAVISHFKLLQKNGITTI